MLWQGSFVDKAAKNHRWLFIHDESQWHNLHKKKPLHYVLKTDQYERAQIREITTKIVTKWWHISVTPLQSGSYHLFGKSQHNLALNNHVWVVSETFVMFEGLVDDVESSEWNIRAVCLIFYAITYSLQVITISTSTIAMRCRVELIFYFYMKIAFII